MSLEPANRAKAAAVSVSLCARTVPYFRRILGELRRQPQNGWTKVGGRQETAEERGGKERRKKEEVRSELRGPEDTEEFVESRLGKVETRVVFTKSASRGIECALAGCLLHSPLAWEDRRAFDPARVPVRRPDTQSQVMSAHAKHPRAAC